MKAAVLKSSERDKMLIPLREPAKYAKILHCVVTLDGVEGADKKNEGRLDHFLANWREKCGNSIEFIVCPGMPHHITGAGLTMAFAECIDRSYNLGADAVFVYEDDAVLFDTNFCNPDYQRNLLSARPLDTLTLLMGGHHFVLATDGKHGGYDPYSPFVKLMQSYGSYGYALTRPSMKLISNLFSSQASECINEQRKCSPDVTWYHLARSLSKSVYVINPLLVGHEKGTYSNTWKKLRSSTRTGEEWMEKTHVFDMINHKPNLNIK